MTENSLNAWGEFVPRRPDLTRPKPEYIHTALGKDDAPWILLYSSLSASHANAEFETLRKAFALGDNEVNGKFARWAMQVWPGLREYSAFHGSGGAGEYAAWTGENGFRVIVRRDREAPEGWPGKKPRKNVHCVGLRLPKMEDADPFEQLVNARQRILPYIIAYLIRQPQLNLSLGRLPEVMDSSIDAFSVYGRVLDAEMHVRSLEGREAPPATLLTELTEEWCEQLILCATKREALASPVLRLDRGDFVARFGLALPEDIGRVVALETEDEWARDFRDRITLKRIANIHKAELKPANTLPQLAVWPEDLAALSDTAAYPERLIVLAPERLATLNQYEHLSVFSQTVESYSRIVTAGHDSTTVFNTSRTALANARKMAMHAACHYGVPEQEPTRVKSGGSFFEIGVQSAGCVFINTTMPESVMRALEQSAAVNAHCLISTDTPNRRTRAAAVEGVMRVVVHNKHEGFRSINTSNLFVTVAEALLAFGKLKLPTLLQNVLPMSKHWEETKQAFVNETMEAYLQSGLVKTHTEAAALVERRPELARLALRLIYERPIMGKKPLATAEDFAALYSAPENHTAYFKEYCPYVYLLGMKEPSVRYWRREQAQQYGYGGEIER